MKAKLGDRVGALLFIENDEVHLIGYGIYEGDVRINSMPPEHRPVGFLATLMEEDHANPLIKLDDGQYVWGCECWWGPEEEIKKICARGVVVPVNLGEVRCEVRAKLAREAAKSPPPLELALLENTGRYIRAHSLDKCSGPPCPIHHRSNHHMRTWPQHWRSDRHIMERLCAHGVGHPDPDEPALRRSPSEGIHGCCGCCTTAKG